MFFSDDAPWNAAHEELDRPERSIVYFPSTVGLKSGADRALGSEWGQDQGISNLDFHHQQSHRQLISHLSTMLL